MFGDDSTDGGVYGKGIPLTENIFDFLSRKVALRCTFVLFQSNSLPCLSTSQYPEANSRLHFYPLQRKIFLSGWPDG